MWVCFDLLYANKTSIFKSIFGFINNLLSNIPYNYTFSEQNLPYHKIKVNNRALPSLHGGSLEIKFYSPFKLSIQPVFLLKSAEEIDPNLNIHYQGCIIRL